MDRVEGNRAIAADATSSDQSDGLHRHSEPAQQQNSPRASTADESQRRLLDEQQNVESLLNLNSFSSQHEIGIIEPQPENVAREDLSNFLGFFSTTPIVWFTIVSFIPIIFYLADVGSDIDLAMSYHTKGEYWYFVLTAVFIILPSGIIWLLSSSGFERVNELVEKSPLWKELPPRPRCLKFFIVLCHFCGISLLAWYADRFYYGLLLETEKKKLIEDDKNGLLITTRRVQVVKALCTYYDTFPPYRIDEMRLIEGGLECAPQMILQVYILATSNYQIYTDDPWKVRRQCLSIATSILSLAWMVATEMLKSPTITIYLEFVAHCLLIIARTLAIGMFITISTWIVLPMLIVSHCTAVFVWSFFREKKEHFYDALIFSIVTVFVPDDGAIIKSKCYYLLYYAICFVENTLMIVVWFALLASDAQSLLSYLLFFGHFASFFVGIGMLCILKRKKIKEFFGWR